MTRFIAPELPERLHISRRFNAPAPVVGHVGRGARATGGWASAGKLRRRFGLDVFSAPEVAECLFSRRLPAPASAGQGDPSDRPALPDTSIDADVLLTADIAYYVFKEKRDSRHIGFSFNGLYFPMFSLREYGNQLNEFDNTSVRLIKRVPK